MKQNHRKFFHHYFGTRLIARSVALSVAMGFSGLIPLPVQSAERTGTSQADLPKLIGRFVVHNPTDVAIKYSVKWGDKAEWTRYELNPRRQRNHDHALNNGKAPAPYVRWDDVGGDGKSTYAVLHMEFGKVGYTGYGPRGNVNDPIDYEFRYSRDGRHLSLVKR